MIDALAKPRQKVVAGKSRMDLWVETLDEPRGAAVLAAAANPSWGHVDLLNELIRHGAPPMQPNTFADWRRKKGLPRVS